MQESKMASFDSCRFDFRLDDNKRLKPAYRRRQLHSTRHSTHDYTAENNSTHEYSSETTTNQNSSNDKHANIECMNKNGSEDENLKNASPGLPSEGYSCANECKKNKNTSEQDDDFRTNDRNSKEHPHYTHNLIRKTLRIPNRGVNNLSKKAARNSEVINKDLDTHLLGELSPDPLNTYDESSSSINDQKSRSSSSSVKSTSDSQKHRQSSIRGNEDNRQSRGINNACPPYPSVPRSKSISRVIPGLLSTSQSKRRSESWKVKEERLGKEVGTAAGYDSSTETKHTGYYGDDVISNSKVNRGTHDSSRLDPSTLSYDIICKHSPPNSPTSPDPSLIKNAKSSLHQNPTDISLQIPSESPSLSPTLPKPVTRRQRRRKAHLAGSGQLTMCPYCSALFDNRKSLLSHQLTDLQCRLKQVI